MNREFNKLTSAAIKARDGMKAGSGKAKNEYSRLVREQRQIFDEVKKDSKR